MEASTISPEAVERANELYWGSDRSVNQIADDLDLSKGALYAVIAPLPAGLGCPLCGEEVVYSNRTAQDRGKLECPSCGWDGAADETVERDVEDDGASEALAPPPPAPWSPATVRTVAGGALLGAAVGLAFVLWARRR